MSQFAYTPKNCWEVYSSAAHQRAIEGLAARYLEFLTRCKTERETVDYVGAALKKAGFTLGGPPRADKFARSLQGKSLFVARRGPLPLRHGLRLIFAHTDSPRLDLKQRPLQEQSNVGQAKTHYYGGIRKHQWLARPLALHGVVVKANGETVRVVLGEAPGEFRPEA